MADDSEEKKVYTSRRRRFFKLGGLSARVGSSYLGERVKEAFMSEESKKQSLKDTNIANAERVVQTFGQMKGAVMKLGQHISLAADILPPEITEILSQLQSKAPPVPFSQLRQQFIDELDKAPEECFEWIDEKAHASASIGQVHRARLNDGREVVVKIQYPKVDEMVESDLANLRSLVKTMGNMWFKADVTKFFDEVRERLSEELDYKIESYNLRLFRKLFSDRDDIVIPEPIDRYCSQRVLTMTYHEGRTWDEICSESTDQELRNRFAARLFELLLHQLFDLNVLHSDPHQGNYALDEEDRIVIYDFGCIKKFEPEFMETYRATIRDGFHGKYDRLPQDCDKLGLTYEGKSKLDIEFYRSITEILKEPFTLDGPYPIHKSKIHFKLHDWAHDNMLIIREFDAPEHLVMANRVLGGMYGNFRRLKANIKWGEILAPYIPVE